MKQRRLTRGISGIITVVLLIGVIAAALPTAAKGTDGGTSSAVYYSTDVTAYYVPATRLANENGIPTLANMILMGNILKVMGEFKEESVLSALKKVISAKHADMLDVNLKALKTGAEL